jgi:excisionase family DNA binding protein
MERLERSEEANMAPPLMKVSEAASVARVSQSYIRKLIARGAIGAVRVGNGETGPLRIPVESFLAWLYGSPAPGERTPVSEVDLEPWVEQPEVYIA